MKDQMQGLSEVVDCLMAFLPLTGIVGSGVPITFKVATQQFQSEGGETEEKIQFFSRRSRGCSSRWPGLDSSSRLHWCTGSPISSWTASAEAY